MFGDVTYDSHRLCPQPKLRFVRARNVQLQASRRIGIGICSFARFSCGCRRRPDHVRKLRQAAGFVGADGTAQPPESGPVDSFTVPRKNAWGELLMRPGAISRNVRQMASLRRLSSGERDFAAINPADSIDRTNKRNAMRGPRRALWIIAAAISLATAASPCAAQEPPAPTKIPAETCLACHGIEGFGVPDEKGNMRSLHIDKDKFEQSVHGVRACVDCHKQITEVPHQKLDRVRVGCVQCHRDLWDKATTEGKTQDFAKLGVVVEQIDRYMKSIHARPSMEDQSQTNATCYNCHDPHYVYPKGSPIRAEWRLSIPNTCGKCHQDRIRTV